MRYVWPCHQELLFKHGVYNLENVMTAEAIEAGVKEGMLAFGIQRLPLLQMVINPILIAIPQGFFNLQAFFVFMNFSCVSYFSQETLMIATV